MTSKIKFCSGAIWVILICIPGVINAQGKVFPLWEDSSPHTKKELDQDQLGKGGRITMVAIPELIVYFPKKETANQMALMICPGGGYGHLAMENEGHSIAKAYAERGYLAAILKYRLPYEEFLNEAHKVPLADAQQGIRLLRQHAMEWNINTDRIGIVGFSAGGHLASSVSVHAEAASTEKPESRPDFSILVYPVISMDSSITHQGSRTKLLGEKTGTEWEDFYSTDLQVGADTPPAFLVHSWDDRAVPPTHSIRYAQALNRFGIKVELHLFEKGGHGYGMGNQAAHGNAANWIELSHAWIRGIFETKKY